ncbi:MAG: hypothetical protein ABIP50_03705 [Candidatus Saccharimonadales bacterium]
MTHLDDFYTVTGIRFQYWGVMQVPPDGTVRSPEPISFKHGLLLRRSLRYEDDVARTHLTYPATIHRTQLDDKLSPPGEVAEDEKVLHFWYIDGATQEDLDAFAAHVFETLLEHEFSGTLQLF